MRGYPEFNYPAFQAVASHFRGLSFEVRSPDEKDLEDGFDGNLAHFSMEKAMQWDLEAVLWANYISLLPGWEKSQGVAMEAAVARATGKKPILIWLSDDNGDIYVEDWVITTWETIDKDFPNRAKLDLNKLLNITQAEHETLLAEKTNIVELPVEPIIAKGSPLEVAYGLVHGNRGANYGHPIDDFARTGKIWEAILGHPVSPEEVALCMIGVKLSRLVNTPGHEDSVVDIAGYTETYDMVRKERAVREATNKLEQWLGEVDDMELHEGPFYVEGLGTDEEG